MSKLHLTPSCDKILSATTVRERANKVFEYVLSGKGKLQLDFNGWENCVEFVHATILENYPDLNIPAHTRWNHFKAGGIDRVANWKELDSLEKLEKARVLFELVVISVFLDAGAGDLWTYNDNGHTYCRSEGLAVASFNAFKSGLLGNTDGLTSECLRKINVETLQEVFQVSETNPIVGLNERSEMISRLANCIDGSDCFVGKRLGGIIDFIVNEYPSKIEAQDILKILLFSFSKMWPARVNIDDVNISDAWMHPLFKDEIGESKYIPFHKLTQWLCYSVFYPLETLGILCIGQEKLTGLPEYRNGGLFVDFNVIKFPTLENIQYKVDDQEIVEWRACTIALLDRIADDLQKRMKLSNNEFPLAKVLEGGTWSAGRRIAKTKRSGGGSPVPLLSDGTVF